MDALALGGFRSRIAGVLGVRGLKVKADVKSLERNRQSRVRATAHLGVAGGRKDSPSEHQDARQARSWERGRGGVGQGSQWHTSLPPRNSHSQGGGR